ncbi:MAG: hypothetical protein QME42_04365 [bacterium]|nr:hypothetical protein [bacterium]
MLEDTLKEIENTSNWSKGEKQEYCSLCNKREVPLCRTKEGQRCAECIAYELKVMFTKGDIITWPVSQFKEILRTEGNLCYRLILFGIIKDVLQIVSQKSPADVNELLIAIVWNLGYAQPHPLAHKIRSAAVKACIALGETILPILLRIYEPKPWQFYANIVLVAGSIAPENPQVKILLEKAAKSHEFGVREYVLQTIALHNSTWAKEIVLSMLYDHEPSVRSLATQIASSFKLRPITKSSPSQLPTQKQVQGLKPLQGLKPFTQMQLFNKNQVESTSLTPLPKQIKSISPPPLTRAQRQIAAIIDNSYNTDVLKKLYSRYIYRLFSEDELSIKDKSIAGNSKKTDLIYILTTIYSNKELFQKLFDNLPQDVRQTLNLLIWQGGKHNVEKLEKMFKSRIVEEDRYSPINNNYLLFQISQIYGSGSYFDHSRYSLYLPEGLRKLFKQHLIPPEEYNLIPVDTIEETRFVYEDNERILKQIKLFVAYIQQGNLKTSKNSNKLLKSSLKQMAKYCHIEEFYDSQDEELTYIKTQLIAVFLKNADIKSLNNSPELLKELFNRFFSSQDFVKYQLRELLFHIKGDSSYRDIHENREEKVRQVLFNLLGELPQERWISIENLIKYCFYKDIMLEIVNKSAAGRYLYYNVAFTNKYYSGYEKAEITEDVYNDVIIVPLIKAVMFLLSSFGLVDIAYTIPENTYFKEKDHNYLCIFDGLKYIKLTKLCSYILGKIQKYEVKFEEEKAKIVLDEKRLIIHLQGKDMLKSLILEKIADRLGDNYYRVDYHSFLKDCLSKRDIQQKVIFFKEQICSNPSPIWQDFLDEVLKRVNPLKGVPGMRVYKLAQDKGLISLIARDEVLKNYILKAEDYHLLVDANSLGKVKKRLVTAGYFIDNM